MDLVDFVIILEKYVLLGIVIAVLLPPDIVFNVVYSPLVSVFDFVSDSVQVVVF